MKMSQTRYDRLKLFALFIFLSIVLTTYALAQGAKTNPPAQQTQSRPAKPAAAADKARVAQQQPSMPAIPFTQKDMTLWQMLKAGGAVMIVIGFISVIALAIIVYNFMTLKVGKLAPREFYETLMAKLKDKDMVATRDLCLRENNILAKIVLEALDKNHTKTSVREMVEHRARIEISNLWQHLNYLSDIVAVAPLLGLLGTVLGMIQAFQAVPLQSGMAKTALLAAGIAKAMIATASGLIVAIPVLMAYSYFRGRVQEVTNIVELYTTEITKAIDSI
jgi:biopolymer transport protein ExbB